MFSQITLNFEEIKLRGCADIKIIEFIDEKGVSPVIHEGRVA